MEAGPVWPLENGALPGNAWVNADRENASFMRMRNITLAYNWLGTYSALYKDMYETLRYM